MPSYMSSKQLWKIALFKEETKGKRSTARTSLGYISELFDRYLLKVGFKHICNLVIINQS